MKYQITIKCGYTELKFAANDTQEMDDIISLGLKNGYTIIIVPSPESKPVENDE